MIKRIKLDKFFITTLIVVVALIAYAIFFASPAFGSLASAANNVAVGLIAATAIAYALAMSIMLLAARSKTSPLKVNNNQPPMGRIHSPQQVKAVTIAEKANAFVANTRIVGNISENKLEQNTQATQPLRKPTSVKQEVNVEEKPLRENRSIQQRTEPMIAKKEVAPTLQTIEEQKNVEVATARPPKLTPGKANKLTCPSCKKRFSTPLYLVDYSSSKPRLAGHCPYCNTVVVTLSDSTQQTINSVEVEEYFKRGSSPPKV